MNQKTFGAKAILDTTFWWNDDICSGEEMTFVQETVYIAYTNGYAPEDNPYDHFTDKHWEWMEGWESAAISNYGYVVDEKSCGA